LDRLERGSGQITSSHGETGVTIELLVQMKAGVFDVMANSRHHAVCGVDETWCNLVQDIRK